MKALILSCSTGEGHNSCAAAIKEIFENNGDECTVEDALTYISPRFSHFIAWGHVFMYRHMPALFAKGYNGAEKRKLSGRNRRLVHSLLSAAAKKLAETINKSYDIGKGYDIVICTHVFSALLMTETAELCSYSPITAFVATDYTCSPITESGIMDLYFIPAAETAVEFTAKGIDAARLVVSGLPVRKDFYIHTPKTRAKTAEGIPSTHRHLLVMCGSMGCGNLEKLTSKLASELASDEDLTIVCGTNRKVFLQLEEKHRQNSRIHIRGYVNNIALLMDSADLYITKPGGISVSEAGAKRLPMVFINAVAGCESYNLRYFCRIGAAASTKNIDDLAVLGISLLRDPHKLAQMASAYDHLPAGNAAENIYQKILEVFNDHKNHTGH